MFTCPSCKLTYLVEGEVYCCCEPQTAQEQLDLECPDCNSFVCKCPDTEGEHMFDSFGFEDIEDINEEITCTKCKIPFPWYQMCPDCHLGLPCWDCTCPDIYEKFSWAEDITLKQDRSGVDTELMTMYYKKKFAEVEELLSKKGFKKETNNEYKFMFPDNERFIIVLLDLETRLIEVNFNGKGKYYQSPYDIAESLKSFNI